MASTPEATVIFRSANDTLRDVLSTFPHRNRTTSSLKRGRANSDTECELEGVMEINDGDDDGHVSFLASPANGMRQTRPLRRSKRPLMETRSLPAGAMRFRHGDGIVAPSNIDEDWSTGTLDMHQMAVKFPNPDLPDGRSENFIK